MAKGNIMINIENKISVYYISDDYVGNRLVEQTELNKYREIKTPHGYIYASQSDARIHDLIMPYIKKYNLHNVTGNVIISANSILIDEIMDTALVYYVRKNKRLPDAGSPIYDYYLA